MECKNCQGTGKIPNPDQTTCGGPYVECPECGGTGLLPIPEKDKAE